MTRPHPAWRDWTAIAAAYLLVLQMLFTGMATSVQAAPGTPAHFAGILCLSAAPDAVDLPGDDGSPHAQSPGCCVLGCPMFSPGAAPPAANWTPSHASVTTVDAAHDARRPQVPRSAHGPSPSLARAPPSAA